VRASFGRDASLAAKEYMICRHLGREGRFPVAHPMARTVHPGNLHLDAIVAAFQILPPGFHLKRDVLVGMGSWGGVNDIPSAVTTLRTIGRDSVARGAIALISTKEGSNLGARRPLDNTKWRNGFHKQ